MGTPKCEIFCPTPHQQLLAVKLLTDVLALEGLNPHFIFDNTRFCIGCLWEKTFHYGGEFEYVQPDGKLSYYPKPSHRFHPVEDRKFFELIWRDIYVVGLWHSDKMLWELLETRGIRLFKLEEQTEMPTLREEVSLPSMSPDAARILRSAWNGTEPGKILNSLKQDKISVVKLVDNLFNMGGLKEAKEWCDKNIFQ